MKCEVYWKNAEGKPIHPPSTVDYGVGATHLSIGSPMDDSTGLEPTIFAVCEEHADLGAARSGWKKISAHVARHIGQMEEALRLAP